MVSRSGPAAAGRRGDPPAGMDDDEFETLAPRSAWGSRAKSGADSASHLGSHLGSILDSALDSAPGSAATAATGSNHVPAEAAQADDPGDGSMDCATRASSPARQRAARKGLSLRARAVGYLSRREHARQELARKLAPHSESPEQLQDLLDALEREGWLSTARYAQSVVHRRAGREGTARITQTLRQQGVDAAQIDALRTDLRATEYQRALTVWQKRFGEPPPDRAAYAKQARFLAGRGFDHEVIRRILGGREGD